MCMYIGRVNHIRQSRTQSVTIRANQCQSEAIQRQSVAIRCNQVQSGAISGQTSPWKGCQYSKVSQLHVREDVWSSGATMRPSRPGWHRRGGRGNATAHGLPSGPLRVAKGLRPAPSGNRCGSCWQPCWQHQTTRIPSWKRRVGAVISIMMVRSAQQLHVGNS